jgi:pimeloyl-ACP methyl ester carboxylesterase
MKRLIYFNIIFLFLSLISGKNIYAQPDKVKSIDGVEIFFEVYGDGDLTLFFVHGWSCDKSYWKDQVSYFSKYYKVVTVDLAGHGESGLERKDYKVELFGEDVASVVNHLKLSKVILIGHSMGGSVILEAARKLTGKVIGLIGVDTYQSFKDDWTSEQKEGFLKPIKENFVAASQGFVRSMFPKDADTLLVKKVVEDMSAAPPNVAVSAMRNLFYYDPVPTLEKIKLPIVSINCDMYPVSVEENKNFVKDYEVKLMKGVGHFLMMEKPEEFNELLLESANKLLSINEYEK